MYSIGIDIGGTNLPVGIVDLETKKIVSRRSTPFVRGMSPQEAMDRVAQLAREQMAALSVDMSQVAFAGMGVPAVLMPDKGYVVHANNLDWYDVEITSILEEKLGCRVYLENDANAAAWAEYIAGACRGTNTSVVLTLGTGLGGGVIIDGKMLWGSFYNGGELGHMIVEAENGIPCTCGNRGCIERYTAATALIYWGKKALENGEITALSDACGGEADRINAKMVIDCARESDPVCCAIFEKYVHYLAIMCLNMVNFLDPEVIAIGGGVSEAGDFLMEPLKKEVYKLIVNKDRPYADIRRCELGSDAGIIGAALLGLGREH